MEVKENQPISKFFTFGMVAREFTDDGVRNLAASSVISSALVAILAVILLNLEII